MIVVVIDKYRKVVEGLVECGRQSEGRKEGIRSVVKVLLGQGRQ